MCARTVDRGAPLLVGQRLDKVVGENATPACALADPLPPALVVHLALDGDDVVLFRQGHQHGDIHTYIHMHTYIHTYIHKGLRPPAALLSRAPTDLGQVKLVGRGGRVVKRHTHTHQRVRIACCAAHTDTHTRRERDTQRERERDAS
jgi:hypothetical protein